DPNSTYLVNNSYYEFCFKIGIKKVVDNKLVIYPRTLDRVIKFAKSSYDNKPVIISGLEFSGDAAGLAINSDAYTILHNITIDKSKHGIELNCPNGCLVANSTLTGVSEIPPKFSTGIKTLGKGITINGVTISAYDIGIDAQGENILVEESSITNNKLFGIRVDSTVKNLSIKSMESMIENGDGIKTLDTFMLEEGAKYQKTYVACSMYM
ncbi:MAG: right-handed parallel beta-helix repeat-containing protein, partial [Pseudomonadota bacterium]